MSAAREVGLMEFRFRPDLFKRVRVGIQSRIEIDLDLLLGTGGCQAGTRRGPISKPLWVRKAEDRYPTAAWQMRRRPEPEGRDPRQR